MPQTKGRASFHRYLADSPESEAWGVAVTAAGRQLSPAGAAYPPAGHPADHAFSWEKGRVLAACQVVLITAGRGRFESRATGLQPVEAGTALVVLPGVWHRYAPDPATGWEEQWIELRGAVVENLQRRGVLSPKHAVIAVERRLELAGIFDGILARFGRDTAVACDPERAALGLQVLALISGVGGQGETPDSVAALIGRAERLLADRVESAPAMPALARELGVAYSHFRREFKRHTGLSPQRYLGQLRLEKACRILGTTAEPVKSIADRLGFCSPYHFSTAFKRHFGVAPDHWRRQHVDETTT
ncbi:MAG: AraC family transcriptional regulator [Candidatus Didemnitutus sp.]|nr:AraC family transcriptional regulator [Candidatus Didemnitutus sp.]